MFSTILLSIASAAATPTGGATITLNDGLSFPYASFGLQVYDDDTAKELTVMAIQQGFRNFFSSVLAGNQNGFGEGVRASAVNRSELFICGSVNTGNGVCSGTDDCKTQTAAGCAQNLQDTGLDYLDMIMLDYPAGDCPSIVGQWQAFEDMLASKKVKSIAVSNFSPDQLDCIVSDKTATVPSVNQMPFSVGNWDKSLVSDDKLRGGVVVQAYSPLASGGVINDPDCIAIGKAHNKSAAQVALRWIVQHNVTFSTQASEADYFKEDVSIFDFELTATEMAKLDAK